MMLWHVIEKGSGELLSTQIVPFAKCFYAQITSHKHLFFLLLSYESLTHFRAVCTRFKTRSTQTKYIRREKEREKEGENKTNK